MRTEYRGKLRRKHAARQLLFSSLLFFFYTIALYSIPSRADLRDHLRPQRPAKHVSLPFVSMKAWEVPSFEAINGSSHLRPKTHIFDLL